MLEFKLNYLISLFVINQNIKKKTKFLLIVKIKFFIFFQFNYEYRNIKIEEKVKFE